MKTLLTLLLAGAAIAVTTLVLAAETPTSPAEPPAPPTAGEKYELKYKFVPGEIIRSEVVHRATVDTTIKGASQTAETRTTSIKVWEFDPQSKPDEVKFVHSVESIDMWQHMKGRAEVSYNSRTDKQAPPGYEDVAKAVGVPLTELTVNDRGKILKRKELHTQSNANPAPLTMPLPDEPVAIGESWTNPQELEVRMQDGNSKKIKTRQKFTLEKVASGVATISVDSLALAPVNDPAIEAQLIQRLPSGSIRFDLEKGRVIAQQMDVDKRVIGFNGPASSMHYLSRFTEEIQPSTETAARPKKTKRN